MSFASCPNINFPRSHELNSPVYLKPPKHLNTIMKFLPTKSLLLKLCRNKSGCDITRGFVACAASGCKFLVTAGYLHDHRKSSIGRKLRAGAKAWGAALAMPLI